MTASSARAARLPTEDYLPQTALADAADISHNLNGQKLGRKGRVTRERILAAAVELLEGPAHETISMSAVARKASLGMTSLYNYFNDVTELLLAVLEPITAEREDAFVGMLRERWPDAELGERCMAFMTAFHGFWARNTRLLHLRNSLADGRDLRMRLQRLRSSEPVIGLLVRQMDGDPDDLKSPESRMASVLMTAIERTVTIATDDSLNALLGPGRSTAPDHFLAASARLMELGIRDVRQK